MAAALALAVGAAAAGVAIYPRPLPPAPPDGESEDVRRDLEAELDAGRPVTLVGETGYPKWFRWRTGKDVQRTHIEPDGTFSAEMLDQHAIGLLELLPDARTDRYKLTAQVRHDQGGYGGFVGLYVAHRAHPRQPHDIQFFTRVRFNAVAATPRILILPKPKERVPENHTQQMSLALHLYTDRSEPVNVNVVWNEVLGPRVLARGPRSGVWDNLEVTVTPDKVTATVAGDQMALTATHLQGAPLHAGIETAHQRHAGDLAVQNLRPEFTPRGGLGLVLYPLSAASVRGVTVIPLPADR